MFVFKVITAIFWLAISLVWAENIYNEVSDQPIFREIVAIFCYGFAICYAIEMLFAKVKWLQLIIYMVIFSIMSAAGCNH